MTMATMRKSTCDSSSTKRSTSEPFSLKAASATPKRIEKSSTWRMSPRANASATSLGMTLSRKSVVLRECPEEV